MMAIINYHKLWLKTMQIYSLIAHFPRAKVKMSAQHGWNDVWKGS